jgi:hypothetical protein
MVKALAGKQAVARPADGETRRTRNRRGPKVAGNNPAAPAGGNGARKRRGPGALQTSAPNGDAGFDDGVAAPGNAAAPRGENRRSRGGRSRKPKAKVVAAA